MADWLPPIATILGILVGVKLLIAAPLESRLDRVEKRLTDRLDRIDQRLNRIDERLDRIDRRLEAVEAGPGPAA